MLAVGWKYRISESATVVLSTVIRGIQPPIVDATTMTTDAV